MTSGLGFKGVPPSALVVPGASARRLEIAWKLPCSGGFVDSMEFSVLGPVGARRDGAPVELGGPKQRSVLALLLLARGESVSRDRLIDGVWGESAPPAAS